MCLTSPLFKKESITRALCLGSSPSISINNFCYPHSIMYIFPIILSYSYFTIYIFPIILFLGSLHHLHLYIFLIIFFSLFKFQKIFMLCLPLSYCRLVTLRYPRSEEIAP